MIKITVMLISVSFVLSLVLVEGTSSADVTTGGKETIAATDACQQPMVIGPCRGSFPRFFYNNQTSTCEKFIYGGCWGNGNNFEILEKCETLCLSGKRLSN